MRLLQPASEKELADALAAAAAAGETVEIRGAGSKRRMGGPAAETAAVLETLALNRVRQYDPRDLTISVEAGMRWAELARLVDEHRQMVPLDPPCADSGTVGGVVAANCAGPRRRQYGAARDMVIGMRYATPEGVVADTGGMVVKNVAGLDIHKALIGSFGTLAAITVVNFKLAPRPELTRTWALGFGSAVEAVAQRDAILRGVLQPSALDVLNPAAAALAGLDGFCVLVRAGGPEPLIRRYDRELAGAQTFDADAEARLWRAVEEFAPSQPYVVRAGHPLADLLPVLESAPGPCVCRAGTGISYLGFSEAAAAVRWMLNPGHARWSRLIEWSSGPAEIYWPDPGPELEWMKKIKAAFDPKGLLNPGRLYGRL
ncbi:MAG: FAD-linked oxidase [Bryobacteraceae bacterium]|nr:MAG: FAD-linked oxidase [Bryobacteraceae bacterium]